MNYKVPKEMKTFPCVFAVANNYQIFVFLNFRAVAWIEIGNKRYYDDSNGILRSGSNLHCIEVPVKDLDAVEKYTVVYRKMIDRKPYFPVSEDPVREDFDFRPVGQEKINIYHISDAHNMEEEPIKAAEAFGEKIDLLILNGDIPNHSGQIKNFASVYNIASAITRGSVPIVFSRGNHDTRGICGELFSNYTPSANGKTYYTFRLGSLWGLVLDCGEDKPDTNDEYGNTVCFHDFRLKESQFLNDVAENADNEYNAPGVKHKIVVCHIPFVTIKEPPFDIEQEIYRSWTDTVCNKIKPEIMLFGHTHKAGIFEPGSEFDSYKLLNCSAIVGSEPRITEKVFIGCGITLSDNSPNITFTKNT